jgi:hypothetical protein
MSDVVDRFLAEQAVSSSRRGTLIFALDATASREETWDAACQLQAEMFREVAAIGQLDVQLVYFRGPAGETGGECRASRWLDSPLRLSEVMAKITCRAGHTQIQRVLLHACQEARRRPISALVFVGDACEEARDDLLQQAATLGQLKIPVFMLQEGSSIRTRRVFQEIAQATNGAYLPFGAHAQLAELLRAIALYAVAGATALEGRGGAAQLLLGQMRGSLGR